MIVRDDRLALTCLAGWPEVDPQRIAATGMSMGSTRSWWLAALDERVKVVASVSCLTRYQNLIAEGELRQHGIYYFVPGMLKEQIDTESVIGLIAPRPHLTLTGDRDAGSPAAGARSINRFQEQLYRLYGRGDDFCGLLFPGLGHVYTPAMWQQTRAWLKRHL
jgi:dienelactone hydrolase